MKSLLALLLTSTLALWSLASEGGPIGVGNGGGSSEYSVVFAHENLVSLLKDCANYTCNLQFDEHVILTELIGAALDSPLTLKFSNSQLLGKLRYKIVDENVFVNQDLLWVDAAKTVSYEIGDALSLWVTITADRIGETNPIVNSIAAKVKRDMQQSMGRGRYDAPKDYTFEFLEWKKLDQPDVLVIRDPFLNVINVTEMMIQQVGCPGNLEIELYSPAWLPIGSTTETTDVTLALDFGAKITCDGNMSQGSARLFVTAKRDKKNDLAFDLQSTILQLP